jgi:hypothetical protein
MIHCHIEAAVGLGIEETIEAIVFHLLPSFRAGAPGVS